MIDYQNEDYQTHVFTSTYTADVSGVCSAMYELGGMTVLHDPSGCNSTYSTHDEPRWFDTNSLMFVSGLDEMTAVLGDDNVLVEDVAHAAADLKPRFITLCGGSIPHIIAFDYKGVARLIEKRTGIPTIPVVTNGNRAYTAGVGAALTAWVKRFGNPKETPDWSDNPTFSFNLLGVTPLDFSVNGNVEALRSLFADKVISADGTNNNVSNNIHHDSCATKEENISASAQDEEPYLNCCAAMGEDFESLCHIYRGAVNIVVSSSGRRLARYMEQIAGTPWIEGVPVGAAMTSKLQALALETHRRKAAANPQEVSPKDSVHSLGIIGSAAKDSLASNDATLPQNIWGINPEHDRWDLPDGQILVIGEEIFAQSLAAAINVLDSEARQGLQAYAIWPDPDRGFPEKTLAKLIRKSRYIIADPLYQTIPHDEAKNTFIPFPHEAYSGRIFRNEIPKFVGPDFDVADLLRF